jgi:hypothetical protein
MKFKILIFFLYITSIFAKDTNSNNGSIDLNKFLSDMQDQYHLKIIEKKKIDIILTGQTFFDYNINRNYTYSCFKIKF